MTTFPRTDPSIEKIIRLLQARCGLSFRPNDYDRVERGIVTAQHQSKCQDLRAYEQLLRSDSEVWDALIVELTVGETYFFREPMQFEFIRRNVLPDILNGRDLHCPIRLWSAGCASGEEAYSLAILFDQERLLERADILATDISTAALTKAREGVYREWSLRGSGAVLAKPYLKCQPPFYVITERIRRRVKFEMLNLAVDSYPSIVTGTRSLDLILCRNVLIYFDNATVRAIAERFFHALAGGGWLLTAASDPDLQAYAPFETVLGSGGVFYRKTAVAESSSAGSADSIPSSARANSRTRRPISTTATAVPSSVKTRLIADPALEGDAFEQQADRAEKHRQPDTSSQTKRSSDAFHQISLDEVRQELSKGRYRRVLELTSGTLLDHDACVIRIQALANINIVQAERACELAVAQHPLSTHLRYLHAVLLSENNRGVEAADAARRVIFLDRKLAVAHLLLGSSLRQAGDLQGALRAFRNATELCNTRPANEIVPFSDGETAAQIARAADLQMRHIASASGGEL